MSTMASQITSLTIVYSKLYESHRSKKTSKLRVTDLCEGNSPVIGEFPAQRASNAENVSIWWRHRVRPKQNDCHLPFCRHLIKHQHWFRECLGDGQATSHYTDWWLFNLLTDIWVSWSWWIQLIILYGLKLLYLFHNKGSFTLDISFLLYGQLVHRHFVLNMTTLCAV